MDEKDIPPKIKKDILEHLAMAEYALFYVYSLLKKLKEQKIKQKNNC